MGSPWATPKAKKIFFFRNNKPDHKLSKTFYFIKISYAAFEVQLLSTSAMKPTLTR